MAITTTGGSGSGTTSVTTVSTVTVTLFTTPSTSNAIFIVTVTWGSPIIGIHSVGLGGPQATAAGTGQSPHIIKVGPSTDVKMTWGNVGATTNTVAWNYNWVGVVIT